MHSVALHDQYGATDKVLLNIDQTHNAIRPTDTNEQIAKFLAYRLTGNLVAYRGLLENAIVGGDEPVTAEGILPSGWSNSNSNSKEKKETTV